MEGLPIDCGILKQKYCWIRLAAAFMAFCTLLLMVSSKQCGYVKIECDVNSSESRSQSESTSSNDSESSSSSSETESSDDDDYTPLERLISQAVCVQYPFNLGKGLVRDRCGQTHYDDSFFHMDYSFITTIFTIVMLFTMFYAVATVFLYLIKFGVYNSVPTWSNVDFIISVCIAIEWLAGLSAFASTLNHLKHYTSDKQIDIQMMQFESCRHHPEHICRTDRSEFDSWSTLNVALVFCIIEVLLWLLICIDTFKKSRALSTKPQLEIDDREEDQDVIFKMGRPNGASKYKTYEQVI